MEALFIFVQTQVVTPLVLRSDKSMTKVTTILWLSGLASLQQGSEIEVQGNKKPTQSFVPYGVMKVGSWAIALRYLLTTSHWRARGQNMWIPLVDQLGEEAVGMKLSADLTSM